MKGYRGVCVYAVGGGSARLLRADFDEKGRLEVVIID